jgi:hypothetical protein
MHGVLLFRLTPPERRTLSLLLLVLGAIAGAWFLWRKYVA